MLNTNQNQLDQAGNIIRLTVKVSELFMADYPPKNETAINDYTKLENQWNISDYGDPKSNFSTDVKKGGALLWKIEFEDNSERKDYRLELVCILEKKSSHYEFFDFDPLLPVRNLIIATPNHGNPGDIYDYNIIFNITDDYRNSQTYMIDPQLRMT